MKTLQPFRGSPPACRTSALVVAASLVIGATGTHAATVVPADVALARLKTTAAATKPDGYVLKSVKLKGDLNNDGIKFTWPTVVPEKPLVLMQQKIANCNTLDVTAHADVNKTTENSEEYSREDTIGGETSVTVGAQGGIFSAEATQSINYSTTNTTTKTHTEAVSWTQGIDVPVAPKSSLTVQFVVAEQKLDNIPWSTNVVLAGPAELTYERPAKKVEVCLYEHSGYKGKKKCFETTKDLGVAKFKEVKWEGGGGNLNDEVTAIKISGDATVRIYQHHDYKGWVKTYKSSDGNVGASANDKFSSMKIDMPDNRKVETKNIETLLSDDQRRIRLTGKYKAVNGVEGQFRAGAPVALKDSDCGLVVASSAMVAPAGTPQKAGMTAKPQAGMPAKPQPGKLAVTKTEDLRNVAPIQGTVLKAGVKPASKVKVPAK